MAQKYIIRDGFTFRDSDGNVKGGGEQIEIDDDIAAANLHKLELVDKKARAKALIAEEKAEAERASLAAEIAAQTAVPPAEPQMPQ